MAKPSKASGHKWTKEQREKFRQSMAVRREQGRPRNTTKTQVLLAKKLRVAILARVKTDEDLAETELLALLLINEVLKGKLGD